MSFLGAIGAGIGGLWARSLACSTTIRHRRPLTRTRLRTFPVRMLVLMRALASSQTTTRRRQTLPTSSAQLTQNIINNPYGQQYQQGAGVTGAAGVGGGANVFNTAQSFLPYAQQTLQTGFDPQNALYNQQFQLQTDQDRAAQAARGIATSPYGAGVENKANSDFNIAWQNAQLQRQSMAGQTASGLLGAAGTGTTTGLNTMLQGTQLPYSTYNSIQGAGLTALGAYGQQGALGTTTANTQIADLLQYLGLGNQSAAVNNQNYANQITAQNNQFNQQQTLGKNLGSSLTGLGTYFGGGMLAGPDVGRQPATWQ